MPSNHGQPKVPLTNIEVMERVTRFLRTGDARHLPPALRREAEGIFALAVRSVMRSMPPWPAGAAQPDPGPRATLGEILRALTGDERADADSGLSDDGGPEAER
jgi:hypothetical protein